MTNSLRSATTLYVSAGLLAGAILVAHLMPVGGGDVYLRGAIFDLGHVAGFAVITVLSIVALRRRAVSSGVGAPGVPVVALLFTLGLAVLAEAAQYPTRRDASFADLLRDVSGIAAGLLIVLASRQQALRRAALFAGGLAFFVVGLVQPLLLVTARTIVWLESTTALGFERWFERQLIESGSASIEFVPAPAAWQRGGTVLRVVPSGDEEAEGFTVHGLPRDWSRYTALSFTMAAEGPQLQSAMLRIDSPRTQVSRRGRFRSRFAVGTEPREIAIPVSELAGSSGSRPLDVGNVVTIKILAEDAAGLAFFVDDVRLR